MLVSSRSAPALDGALTGLQSTTVPAPSWLGVGITTRRFGRFGDFIWYSRSGPPACPVRPPAPASACGARPQVAVSPTLVDNADGLLVEVTDTGVGVPPEHQQHLFQPFCQADDSITRAHGGMGLGLSLVMGCAKLMGGSAGCVRRADGVGSTFWFTMQAEPSTDPGRDYSVLDDLTAVQRCVSGRAGSRFSPPPPPQVDTPEPAVGKGSLTAGVGVFAWTHLDNGECPPLCGAVKQGLSGGSVGTTSQGKGRVCRAG